MGASWLDLTARRGTAVKIPLVQQEKTQIASVLPGLLSAKLLRALGVNGVSAATQKIALGRGIRLKPKRLTEQS